MAERKSCTRIPCSSASELRREVEELRGLVLHQCHQLNCLMGAHSRTCSINAAQQTSNSDMQPTTVQLTNPRIKNLKPDILYHLGLDTDTTDFRSVFGDVQFICLGGSKTRMLNFAQLMARQLNLPGELVDLAAAGQRYAMYKAGPVLTVSHGIGAPSMSILINELIKLVYHAGCNDPVFIRVGTSAGINVQPGTVVLSTEVLDGQLRNSHEVIVQGLAQLRPTTLDAELTQQLAGLVKPEDGFAALTAKTICTNDFYEGQSRTDGAFAEYSEEDKLRFLNQLSELNVRNMEMEAAPFAAFTLQANIRAAVVCVTTLDRLNGDQITGTVEELMMWEERPMLLVARYIEEKLKCTKRRPSDKRSTNSQPRNGRRVSVGADSSK